MKPLIATAALLTVLTSFPGQARSVDRDENRSEIFADMCRRGVAASEGDKNYLPDQDHVLNFAMDLGDCYGYIRGFIDGHNMTADHPGNHKQFCVPSGVSNIELAKVVIKAANDRPDIGHTPRETLVEYAFKLTWPCDA